MFMQTNLEITSTLYDNTHIAPWSESRLKTRGLKSAVTILQLSAGFFITDGE